MSRYSQLDGIDEIIRAACNNAISSLGLKVDDTIASSKRISEIHGEVRDLLLDRLQGKYVDHDYTSQASRHAWTLMNALFGSDYVPLQDHQNVRWVRERVPNKGFHEKCYTLRQAGAIAKIAGLTLSLDSAREAARAYLSDQGAGFNDIDVISEQLVDYIFSDSKILDSLDANTNFFDMFELAGVARFDDSWFEGKKEETIEEYLAFEEKQGTRFASPERRDAEGVRFWKRLEKEYGDTDMMLRQRERVKMRRQLYQAVSSKAGLTAAQKTFDEKHGLGGLRPEVRLYQQLHDSFGISSDTYHDILSAYTFFLLADKARSNLVMPIEAAGMEWIGTVRKLSRPEAELYAGFYVDRVALMTGKIISYAELINDMSFGFSGQEMMGFSGIIGNTIRELKSNYLEIGHICNGSRDIYGIPVDLSPIQECFYTLFSEEDYRLCDAERLPSLEHAAYELERAIAQSDSIKDEIQNCSREYKPLEIPIDQDPIAYWTGYISTMVSIFGSIYSDIWMTKMAISKQDHKNLDL